MNGRMAIVCGFGLAACAGSSESPSAPITIGMVNSRTGDGGGAGPDLWRARALAFREINECGVLDGQPLLIEEIDDGSTPEGAKAAYGALLNRGVAAIMGPTFSEGALQLKPQIDAGRTLTISQAATSPLLTDLSDYFFRVVPSDVVQAIVLADLIDGEGVTDLCVVHRDDTWGTPLAEALLARLTELHPEGTAIDAPYDPRDNDLSYALDPCIAAGLAAGPGGIVLISYEGDGSLAVDAAVARGWSPSTHRWFLTDGNKTPAFVDLLNDPSVVEGALGTAPSPPPVGSPERARLDAFRADFREEFDHEPTGVYIEHAYDVAYLIAAAVEIAGDAGDREAIVQAIARTSSGAELVAGSWCDRKVAIGADGMIDYLGATGDVDLDAETGDLLAPYYYGIWTVRDGAIEELRTVTVDSLP